jgi:hypothetical protein
MKRAYNESWIENIKNQSVAYSWYAKKVVTGDELEAIKKIFPVGFYRPPFFVKIGLFSFTNLVIAASVGFVSLFLAGIFIDSAFGAGFISLFFGGVFLYFLEYFIKNNHFYYSGTDNALLYAAIAAIVIAVATFTEFQWATWLYFLITTLVLFFALLRYADPLVSVAFYSSWLGTWFMAMTEFSLGKLILPFVIMLVSGITYLVIQWWKKSEKSNYYTHCQDIIAFFSLLTFYLGGNYLVVREGNALINELPISTDISFAPLFYVFTVTIPILYIVLGLKKHDRKLLVVGLLASAFSIFTYRTYHSTLPLEWALTFGGIVLILFCIAVIKFLPRFGLTYDAHGVNELQDFEAFIVQQGLRSATPKNHDGTTFGGGNFGGGGAGAAY